MDTAARAKGVRVSEVISEMVSDLAIRARRVPLAVVETCFAVAVLALVLGGLLWFFLLLAENVASHPADFGLADEAPATTPH